MSHGFKKIGMIAMSAACCCAVVFTGCQVDEADVTAAKDNIRQEQQKTDKVRRDGQAEVNQSETELAAARQRALRVPYDQGKQLDVAKAEKDLADTKLEAKEDLIEQKSDTNDARLKAASLAAELKLTQERDAYLANANAKLAIVDQRIAALETQQVGLTGEALQTVKTETEIMKGKRKILSDAIAAVKAAEVMQWKTSQSLVDQAIEQFDQTIFN